MKNGTTEPSFLINLKLLQTLMKPLLNLFLALILTGCNSPIIADLVTLPGQPFYQDDFSNPSSGWTTMEDDNGSLGYSEGAYKMLVESAIYDIRSLSGHTFKDAQIEVDATRLAGPVDNRFGLICRFQDIDNYYVFIISSDGYYAIGKIKNGIATLLGQEMMAFNNSILQGEGTNHLRFDCVGDTLKGSVNGNPLALTNDADFSTGDAGLVTGAFEEGGVEISFDNFMVYKP